MKIGALLGLLAGVAVSAWLLSRYGAATILALLAHAGWWLVPIILFHLLQLAASALAWRAIMASQAPQAGFLRLFLLRGLREGVNNLLPVAQIGGEFVAVRLLRRGGVKLTDAVAGTIGDLTMELITQIGFTLLGLGLLLWLVGDGGVARTVVTGLAVAGTMAAGLVAAQTFGADGLVERGVAWFGRATGWGGFGEVAGLQQAIGSLYRDPARLARAAAFHSLSWLLGGLEICLAMRVLGYTIGLGPGTVIESLGQALKSAGFAVPGALGIQEGGLIVVCGLFGIAPELAIALSLIKRLRDVALGLPALLVWQRLEMAVSRADDLPAEARP